MHEICDAGGIDLLNQEILRAYSQEQIAKVKLFLSSESGINLLAYDGKDYLEASKDFALKLNEIDETTLSIEEKRLIKFLWNLCHGQK